MKYIMELNIVVKADDRLTLEAIQESLIHQVEVVAGEYENEIVGQPIVEVQDNGKEDA